MKLATIVPFNDLNRFSGLDKVHLVLAHFVGNNEYTKFYRKMKEQGHYVILDNGAWEHLKPMEINELLGKVAILQPSITVAPDYPNKSYTKTVMVAVEFAEKCPTKVMFCPQSNFGDMYGFLIAYNWAKSQPNIDTIALSILNCPIACGITITSKEAAFTRIKILKLLISLGVFSKTKNHHLLGCFVPREVAWIREMMDKFSIENISSIDTSLPVTCGRKGIAFVDTYTGLEGEKPREKLDFDSPVPTECYKQVEWNIRYLKQLTGGEVTPHWL